MIIFDDKDTNNTVLTTYLSLWCDKRKALGITKDTVESSPKKAEYADWQGQFGTQAEMFKTEMKDRIKKMYDPLTSNASKNAGSTSDIVRILKQMEPGVLIDTAYSNGNPGLVFNVEALLKEESEAFSKFLIKIRSMESMGGKIKSDIIYDGTLIKIAYYFPYAGFSVITSLADELISYNRDRDSYSSIAKEEYEKHLESRSLTDSKSCIEHCNEYRLPNSVFFRLIKELLKQILLRMSQCSYIFLVIRVCSLKLSKRII